MCISAWRARTGRQAQLASSKKAMKSLKATLKILTNWPVMDIFAK
jgi:hypothetical protein